MGKVDLKQALKDRLSKSKQVAEEAAKPKQAPKKAKGMNAGDKKPAAAPGKAASEAKPNAALHKTQGKKAGKSAAPATAASTPSAPAGKKQQPQPKKQKQHQPQQPAKKHTPAPPTSKPTPKPAAAASAPPKRVSEPKKPKPAPRPAPDSDAEQGQSWSDVSSDMDSDASADSDIDVDAQEIETPAAEGPKLTKLQEEMQRKLEGAQFRWLNEQLYTIDGRAALDLMKQQPHLFDLYHRGFRAQATAWPTNPVDRIYDDILAHTPTTAMIVDMGCGDAALAQKLKPQGYTVRSFDLVAKPPLVEAADMANVPLKDGVADMVVFSLSLMNTDWGKGAAEGARVLRKGGVMKIAEVKSRIPDLDGFIQCLEELGMAVINKDTSNTMFLMLTLRKKATNVVKAKAEHFEPLKPCIYKRR